MSSPEWGQLEGRHLRKRLLGRGQGVRALLHLHRRVSPNANWTLGSSNTVLAQVPRLHQTCPSAWDVITGEAVRGRGRGVGTLYFCSLLL